MSKRKVEDGLSLGDSPTATKEPRLNNDEVTDADIPLITKQISLSRNSRVASQTMAKEPDFENIIQEGLSSHEGQTEVPALTEEPVTSGDNPTLAKEALIVGKIPALAKEPVTVRNNQAVQALTGEPVADRDKPAPHEKSPSVGNNPGMNKEHGNNPATPTRAVDDIEFTVGANPAKVKETDFDIGIDHLHKKLDMSAKTINLLRQLGISNIDSLLRKQTEFAKASLSGINRGTQKQLYKFCQWYESFYECHGKDIDWVTRFGEETLDNFDPIKGLLDEDLERVCKQMDFNNNVREQLAKLGLKTVGALREKKEELELFSLPNIKKNTQKALLKFVSWINDYEDRNNSIDRWQHDFNDESIAKFEPENKVEKDYRMMLDRLHEGLSDGGISEITEETRKFAAKITTKYLSKQLREQCENKFRPYDVALNCVKSLTHPTNSPTDIIYLATGRTQSGKSTVKAVCAAVHRQLNCLLIIITKGVSERNDLNIKLNRLLGGCRETMDAGLLVIADTGAQIARATRMVEKLRNDRPETRFGIIVDECDAMYRTTHGEQLMERRYAELMKMKPSFRMEISATIFSAIQVLDEQGKNIELMGIMATGEYSGIQQMKPLQDSKSGKELYLDDDDDDQKLNHKSGVAYTVTGLTDLADKGCTEVLFSVDTDVVCTKFTLRGSKGIDFRLPGHTKGRFIKKNLKTISEVIEKLDAKLGLETPIVIFGYSRLCRCVSFRSEERVPTHIVVTRGSGTSLEDYIQALGRATFNGLSTLKKNGHDNVTVLTNSHDFTAAKKYYIFMDEFTKMLKNNSCRKPIEALKLASKKLPDEANFLRHTNRKIGRRKDLKGKCPDSGSFEAPSNYDDLNNLRDKYWTNASMQRVLTIVSELAEGEDQSSFTFTLDDIRNSLRIGFNITKKELTTNLRMLERNLILEKQKGDDGRTGRWSVKSADVLRYLTNDDIDDPVKEEYMSDGCMKQEYVVEDSMKNDGSVKKEYSSADSSIVLSPTRLATV